MKINLLPSIITLCIPLLRYLPLAWWRRVGGLGTLSLALSTVPGYAQPTPASILPPYFLPKSPTISTLARFDHQQLVNLPTGAAQLAIPLPEVSCGALRLPVFLAYSYTGLQVSQPRDLVGLGWTLQVGSSITRQVNGVVDEDLAQDAARRYTAQTLLQQLTQYTYLKNAYENEVDTAPDLYSFSLPTGVNGRFVIQDTTVVLLPQQPLRVRSLGPQGFQIATEDGVRYQFTAAELTEPHASTFGKVGPHWSAWQLTYVISTDNADTVHLCYTPHKGPLHRQTTLTTGRYYMGTYEQIGTHSTGTAPSCGSTAYYDTKNASMGVSFVTAQYLNSITTRSSQLMLLRAAADSNYELRRLQLITTIGDRHVARQFTLYQSRFTGGTTTDYRLRLDSLQESAGGTALPAYRFTYFSSDASPMPARISAAKDYWGYANGALTNGNFLTNTGPTLLADPHLRTAGVTPANREPNYLFAKAGALLSVRYPTGGSSSWDYEPGRLAANDLQDVPLLLAQPVDLSCVYDPNNLSTVTLVNSPPINPPATLRVTASPKAYFQLPEEDDVELEMNRELDASETGNQGSINNRFREFNLWRRLPSQGNLPSRDSLITTQSDGTSAYKVLPPLSYQKFTFHLQPGSYMVRVYCESLESFSELSVTFHYHDSTQVRQGLPGPGIRVTQTTTLAPGARPLVRTYAYTLGRYSSGRSLLPDNGRSFEAYPSKVIMTSGGQGGFTGQACDFMVTSSNNRGLGNDFNKYDFYYAAVTEETVPSQGKTTHAYTHLAQQFNDVVPLNEVVYRQDPLRPSGWQVAQRTDYIYFTDSLRAYLIPHLRQVVDHSNDAASTDPSDQFAYQLDDVHAAFVVPVLTEQTQYDNLGNALTTLTRSTYQRQRLIRTATRTSTGWTIERYKRLSDYATSPAVRALQVNGFNPLIETQTWRRALGRADSLLVAGHITLYQPCWRSPAQTYRLRLTQPLSGLNREGQLQSRYEHLLSDTRYELETSAYYAPPTGELMQQQAAHGSPTSYLTGYHRTVVMAQAQNATYAQVAYTSFEPAATGRWQYDSLGSRIGAVSFTGHRGYQLDGRGQSAVQRDGLPAGEYELTCWGYGSNRPVLTGASQPAYALVAQAGPQWRQHRFRFHLPAKGLVRLNCDAGQTLWLDEVRLAPVGARLTTYTHDPLVGPTSQTSPDGRTTFYEYDSLGRLLCTRDEQGRILSQQQYHYAGH